MGGVVPVPGGVSQDRVELGGRPRLDLKGIEGVSAALGIDQCFFKVVGGISGCTDVMARLATLKTAIIQSASTSFITCKDNLKPRLLSLPEIPKGLLDESKGILSQMTQFGSESIRRLVAVFSTVEAIQHIKNPKGFLRLNLRRNRLDAVAHEAPVSSRRNRLDAVAHEAPVSSKRNRLDAVAHEAPVSSKRNRLDAVAHEAPVSSKRNRLDAVAHETPVRIRPNIGQSIPDEMISSLTVDVRSGMSSAALAIDSLRKMIGEHPIEHRVDSVADSNAGPGPGGVYGDSDILKMDGESPIYFINGVRFLSDTLNIIGFPDFQSVAPELLTKANCTDSKNSSDVESEVESDLDILEDCTEAELEELLDISTVYRDFVRSFKKISFMVNRLEGRIDLLVNMIYRWGRAAGVKLGDGATGYSIKSGMAGLDLYSELISDRSLHNRLLGRGSVKLSDQELAAVSKEFKGVSGDIDRLMSVIDKIVHVDALNLIEINKYYDKYVRINGGSLKVLSEFQERLEGLNCLLDEALSHVKHVYGIVTPIAVSVRNFNDGFIEELRYSLRDGHSRLTTSREGI